MGIYIRITWKNGIMSIRVLTREPLAPTEYISVNEILLNQYPSVISHHGIELFSSITSFWSEPPGISVREEPCMYFLFRIIRHRLPPSSIWENNLHNNYLLIKIILRGFLGKNVGKTPIVRRTHIHPGTSSKSGPVGSLPKIEGEI